MLVEKRDNWSDIDNRHEPHFKVEGFVARSVE